MSENTAEKTTENIIQNESTSFDCLAVTNVQIFPFKEGMSLGKIKAMASVVLNDQFQIRGLRVVDGTHGYFVGVPAGLRVHTDVRERVHHGRQVTGIVVDHDYGHKNLSLIAQR